MNKKILLFTLISIGIFAGGCNDKQTSQQTSNITKSQRTAKTQKHQSTIIKNAAEKIQSKGQSNNYKKWNGSWFRGKENVPGVYGLINISNSNNKQFKFSFYDSYTTVIQFRNGKSYLYPHVGQADGTAYFNSDNEAYYTNKEFPNYKMTFTMNNNTLTVKEFNINTNADYGTTPFGGVNVRFAGNYSFSKVQRAEPNVSDQFQEYQN